MAVGTLVLPSDCLTALLMTLPEMVRQALRLRFHDESMRVVYPVGHWKVEGSAVPGHVVVTLRTPDGFEVSFGRPAFELLRMGTQGASASGDAGRIVNNCRRRGPLLAPSALCLLGPPLHP